MLRTSPPPRFRAGWHGPIVGPTTMAALLGIDIDALSPEAALDYAVELQRHTAHLAALEARALARAAGATQVERDVLVVDPDDDTERHLTMVDEVREEISAALNRHPATVHTQVDHARLLTGPLGGTLAALQRGDITSRPASRSSPGCCRTHATRPPGGCGPGPDGRSPGSTRRASAVDARATSGALDTPCEASIGQRRGSALIDLVLGLGDPAAEGRPTVAAEVSVVVDPLTGHLLDRGRTRYAVTGALRAFLVARDGTCRFPGCSRRAVSCQVDHAQAWEDGGASDRANVGPLCRRHHQSKTHGGWRILESADDGACTWRSPSGRVCHHRPPDLRPF